MSDRIVARRKFARDLPDGSRIVASLTIETVGDNAHAHFSATAELYERHGKGWTGAARHRHGLEPDACGPMHEEIVAAFPTMAPFVAMHLSAYPSGEPMHAFANGWYFYQRDEGWNLRRLLRVEDVPQGMDQDAFRAFVDAQRARWADEALSARELLTSIPEVR